MHLRILRIALPLFAIFVLELNAQAAAEIRRAPMLRLAPEQLQPDSTGNCALGAPRATPATIYGPLIFLSRSGYSLGFSGFTKSALWVCETIEPAELTGEAGRRDRFQEDPLAPEALRSRLEDFRGSGFDRGHLAAAGNFKNDQTENDESFYLSNIAPQVPAFNQQIWAALEEWTREYVRAANQPVYVVSGGFLYDPAEENPATADGFAEYRVIGPGQVAAPTHFYKIILRCGDAGCAALAFALENRAYARPFRLAQHLVAIDWIEERTGLDFFADCGDEAEAALEASPAAELWPMPDARRHEGKEAEVGVRSDTDVRANTPALRVAAAWRELHE